MNLTFDSFGPPPQILKIPQEPLLSWISDTHLALLLPVVAYWSVSLFFHVLDVYELAELYRIHTPEDTKKKNRCTRTEVVKAVLMQQVIQTVAGLALEFVEPPYTVGHEAYETWKISKTYGVSPMVAAVLYNYVFPGMRMLFAFFIIDTWQYVLHRIMHVNMWCYKHFHSVHHRLYVPYAFGALYNSLIEGFLLDTISAALAMALSRMTPRESMVLFVFSTIKTVDDHCGYEFPYDPLQMMFPNRATYHDIHHQKFGIKTNFSQPFFVHWDTLLSTKYAKTEEYIERNKKLREAAYYEKRAEWERAKEIRLKAGLDTMHATYVHPGASSASEIVAPEAEKVVKLPMKRTKPARDPNARPTCLQRNVEEPVVLAQPVDQGVAL